MSIASRDEAAITDAARRIGARPSATSRRRRWTSGLRTRIAAWAARRPRRFGGIDLLFANAGGPPAGATLSFDDRGVAGRVRAAAAQRPADGPRRGAVDESARRRRDRGLDVVSREGAGAEPGAVDRRALVGPALAKTLALELAADRIRVNHLIPGRIDTDRVRQLDEINAKKQSVSPEEAKKRAMASIPMGRYGEIDEFGRVAAFLLSGAAGYMTGATVQVDGGMIRSVV